MDLRKLKTLIDLVSESNISELEITEAEGKVRIVKAGAVAAAAPMVTYAMPPSAPPPTEAPRAAEPAAATTGRCKQPGFYEAPQCPARSAREDPLRVARGGSFALISTKSVSGFATNPATGDLRLGFRCAHDRR